MHPTIVVVRAELYWVHRTVEYMRINLGEKKQAVSMKISKFAPICAENTFLRSLLNNLFIKVRNKKNGVCSSTHEQPADGAVILPLVRSIK